MAKIKQPTTTAKSTAKETAKGKQKQVEVANQKLVAAFRQLQSAEDTYKSALIKAATIAQAEKCTRAQIVLSYMEARGVTKATAEGQISRVKKILMDEETLQALIDGKMNLKTAREKTTTKQKNPNAERQRANIEKRFSSGLTIIVTAAKEGGYDLASVLSSVKAACKKEGIR